MKAARQPGAWPARSEWLVQELEGLVPVAAPCMGRRTLAESTFVFFSGRAASNAVGFSTFSLPQGLARPGADPLRCFVIRAREGAGVGCGETRRLTTRIWRLGRPCADMTPTSGRDDGAFHARCGQSKSFVLADKLAYCRFSYLGDAAIASEATSVSYRRNG